MLDFLNSGIGLVFCLALIGLSVILKLVGGVASAAYLRDSKFGVQNHFVGIFGVGSFILGWLGAIAGSLGSLFSVVLLILTYVKHH